jgi:hypothetical protein
MQDYCVGKLMTLIWLSTENKEHRAALARELVTQYTPVLKELGLRSLHTSLEASLFMSRTAAANMLAISEWGPAPELR